MWGTTTASQDHDGHDDEKDTTTTAFADTTNTTTPRRHGHDDGTGTTTTAFANTTGTTTEAGRSDIRVGFYQFESPRMLDVSSRLRQFSRRGRHRARRQRAP
jgi:hypothetical protein